MSETEKFTEDILNAAKEKATVVIDEAEAETQRSLEQAKIRSAREVEELLSNARAEAENVKRRRMSEVRHKVQLQEQLEKSKIISDVLEQSRTRVSEMVKESRQYLVFLTNTVATGVREIGLDSVMVHLTNYDLARINASKLESEASKALGRPVKIEISPEPIHALGGAIISSKDGKTRIVSTLDQRFEALEPDLLIQASKILFGEQRQ
jgi:vacuolar-type H+-ATPase subunit E/Vma4